MAPLPVVVKIPPSPERKKLEQILQHFRSEFPADPVEAYAKPFAKSSHIRCNGSGLLTFAGTTEGPKVDELRLCDCARRRRDRFVAKALHFDATRARRGLEFAERTVCPAAELQLPSAAATAPASERDAS
jgi:hypothetical protein